MTEAFYISRGQPDAVHKHLLELLVDKVLSGTSGEARSERAIELINLPLDDKEESWFEEFLSSGSGRTLYGAKDTLMMRRIARGKITDAFYDSEGLNRTQAHGLNWDVLKDGLQKGAGPRLALHEFIS